MRPIGKPQFKEPETAAAYEVLRNATGTAAELATLQRMAKEATGEAKEEIGWFIEGFIVQFGFPQEDGPRMDAER